MSSDIPLAEHESNSIAPQVDRFSRFGWWRAINTSVLLISLFLPWLTTSCEAHVSGVKVVTLYALFLDYPLLMLTLALPAFVLANVLMVLHVPFGRRPWLTVPVLLAISSLGAGGYYLVDLSARPVGY